MNAKLLCSLFVLLGLVLLFTSFSPLVQAAVPNLSIDNVSHNEGNAGTTVYDFTVSLDAPAGPGGVTFDIATQDNSATDPSDYTSNSLTGQTIAQNNSNYTFTVLVNGDTTVEADEIFFVNVTSVAGATLADGQGEGTIVNDDNLVVNATADDDDTVCNSSPGDCTLREAINTANALAGADTITFDIPNMAGCTAANTCTITLGSQLPSINDDVTIDGASNNGHITVSGNDAVRVLRINSGRALSLETLTISNGFATSDHGGGVFNDGGTLNVDHTTFANNRNDCPAACGKLGGAIYNSSGATANINHSTFVGNTAANFGSGGAIYNNQGTLNVTNSTFNNNSAGSNGGAIANFNGTVRVTNSTLYGNSSSPGGGGGVDNEGIQGTTTLQNSIVANSPTGGDCVNVSGTLTADAFNMDSDGSCGNATQKTTAELNLGSLAPNGGPTETMALLVGSHALNAGDDAVCAAAVGSPSFGAGGLDQRGVSRPQGPQCDVGAFEAEVTTAVNVTGFKASVNAKDHVVVEWQTTSESQIAGFNVWRRGASKNDASKKDPSDTEGWKQINKKFKSAKHAGNAAGETYRFTNRNVKVGKTYRYKIEVIYLDNHSEWTNAIQVKTP